jgi:5-methylcytosine-specific restriction protein A
LSIPGIRFEIDRIYSRQDDIHKPFGGQERGGIATPKDYPAIFIFTGESGQQYGYRDGPDESGVFLYTGEGQKGDMRFAGGNRAIRDHAENGKTLHLFESQGKGKGYRYLGEFSCSSYEMKRGPDVDKAMRDVIVFHLVRADQEVDEPPVSESAATKEAKASLAQLRSRAYAALTAPQGRPGRDARRTNYIRAAAVRDYVLARAGGACECCAAPAPFLRMDGSPYLEPHHTTRLSDAGLDHPAHVAGICPTCHREIHYGKGGSSKNEKLRTAIYRKESALD